MRETPKRVGWSLVEDGRYVSSIGSIFRDTDGWYVRSDTKLCVNGPYRTLAAAKRMAYVIHRDKRQFYPPPLTRGRQE